MFHVAPDLGGFKIIVAQSNGDLQPIHIEPFRDSDCSTIFRRKDFEHALILQNILLGGQIFDLETEQNYFVAFNENRKRRKLTTDERRAEAEQAKRRLSSVRVAEEVYG